MKLARTVALSVAMMMASTSIAHAADPAAAPTTGTTSFDDDIWGRDITPGNVSPLKRITVYVLGIAGLAGLGFALYSEIDAHNQSSKIDDFMASHQASHVCD